MPVQKSNGYLYYFFLNAMISFFFLVVFLFNVLQYKILSFKQAKSIVYIFVLYLIFMSKAYMVTVQQNAYFFQR